MTFVYSWKSPDNVRHEGEIDATDRDTAFANLRAKGIRAIRVEPKGWQTGEGYRGIRRRVVIGICLATAVLTAAVVGAFSYLQGRRTAASAPQLSPRRTVIESEVVYIPSQPHPATPHPRHYIAGMEDKLPNLTCFRHPSESYLAQFALPGVRTQASVDQGRQVAEDLCDALEENIVIEPKDSREIAELKQIVAGLKEDAQTYLRSGAGLADYFKFLVMRQRMESDCRQRMIDEIRPDDPDHDRRVTEANEMLESMGLAPIL